jgi:3',5'-cyclic AMP phosphodiesterase CpdA
MAFGMGGTLYTLAGGVLTPIDLARAGESGDGGARGAIALCVQLSDTHIGFNKDANPDPGGSLQRAIDLVNALPTAPALILHTGDITHLSKPEEFDTARQLLSGLKVTELHTVPGEHDVTDAGAMEYFSRFGQPSGGKGYYSFDHRGVHFVALNNVMQFKPGGLGQLGAEQLDWLAADLRNRSASTPLVLVAHMPLWSIYEPWGWGTGDAEQALLQVRRFGSVTVLNGHIHQIVQKVEGNVRFHTARSTAYPQPSPGVGSGPGPLKVPSDQLRRALGVTEIALAAHPHSGGLTDITLE